MKLDTSLFDTLTQYRQQAQSQLMAKYAANYQDKTATSTSTNTSNTTSGSQDSADPSRLDFSQIRRGQAQQWLEKQVAAGGLKQGEINAMRTLLYNGSTDAGDESATKNEQLDLQDKAKAGLRAAVLRKDTAGMAFWAQALGAMKKFQGEKS